MKMVLFPVNSIGRPMIKLQKKRRKKEDFGLWYKSFKNRGNIEDA